MRSRENIWRQRAGLLAGAGLFLAANLGFFLFSRSITTGRKQALEERRAALTREVAAREAEAAKLSSQRDRLAQVSTVIEEFYGRRVGSRRETLAPIVEEIHAVMRKAGVAPAQISYATAPVVGLPLTQMQIGFGFQSDYARFKRLLRSFELNRRWIIVREVSLSRDTETPGEVEVRLGLATYFSSDAAAPPVEEATTGRTTTTVRSVRRTAAP